jgi:hypothetical protein
MAYTEARLTLASTMWYLDFEIPQDANLAKIGGGDKTERGRINEFQTYDRFLSSYDRPYLTFELRSSTVNDLK